MWGKRAVSIMAHARFQAMRSDIEMQSVLRYRSFNFTLQQRGSHIERLGIGHQCQDNDGDEQHEQHNAQAAAGRFGLGRVGKAGHAARFAAFNA